MSSKSGRHRPSSAGGSSTRNFGSSANSTASNAQGVTTHSTAPAPGPRPAANAWSRPLSHNRPRPTSKNNNSSSSVASTSAGATTPSAPPGLTKQQQPATIGTPPPALVSSSLQNIHRERFLNINQSLVGQQVIVTLTSGDILEGIFHTFTPFGDGENKNKYVFKACAFTKSSVKREDGQTLIIDNKDVSQVVVKSMRLEGEKYSKVRTSEVSNGGLQLITDSDISARGGSNNNKIQNGHGRVDNSDDLVVAGSAWTSGALLDNTSDNLGSSRAEGIRGTRTLPDSDFGGSGSKLSDNTNNLGGGSLKGNIGQWDQFSENEKLFNVKASFDEEVYTTRLDRKNLDAKQIKQAERMAKEIEGTVSSNMHVAEERGQKVEGDFDEEDLYSGVIRKDIKELEPAGNKVWGKKGAKLEAEKKKKEEESKGRFTAVPVKKNYASVAASAPSVSGGDNSNDGSGGTKHRNKPPPKSKTPVTSNVQVKSDDNADELPDTASISTETAETTPPKKEKEECSATEEIDSKSKKEDVKKEESRSNDSDESPKEATEEETTSVVGNKALDEKKDVKVEKVKSSSKLNANAKTFNPNAATFTPGSGLNNATQEQQNTLSHGLDDSHAPHPQHYMGPQNMQTGMMHMMHGQIPGGGIRYPNAGPYAYPLQQPPIPQVPSQPPSIQQTQESAQGYEASTAAPVGSEPMIDQNHQPSGTNYAYMPGFYPASGAHHPQTTMMHRATPHMAGGYPAHHTVPQQFPIPGPSGAAHYRGMYQPQQHIMQPQHSMPPPNGHIPQHVHPGNFYNHPNNPGSGVPTSVGNMHGYSSSYGANMGSSHAMGDDTEHSFRGGRGSNRGGGGRGRKNGRKNGRGGGNGGRGGGYHHHNGNQNSQHHSQQHHGNNNDEGGKMSDKDKGNSSVAKSDSGDKTAPGQT